MRPVAIGSMKGGINRLKVKGLASSQQLYDLLNGYINSEGSIDPREGTRRSATLDGTTKGLAMLNGVFNVFATALHSVPTGYKCNILLDPNDNTQQIATILFAKPFMGFLYVVAKFENGDIIHYWLQNDGSWAANTVYFAGDIVEPTVPNGLAYLATRNLPLNATWQPDMSVTVNMLIEPTEYTGFYYKAITVVGDSPHTGSTEPVWPTTEGARVQEFGDFDTATSSTDSTTGSTAQPLGKTITDRYGDSSTIAGQAGNVSSNTAVPEAFAAVATWVPGNVYAPGAVTKPSTGQGAFVNAIPNGNFEAGNDGNWVFSPGGAGTINTVHPYSGTYSCALTVDHSSTYAVMNNYSAVTAGQSVTASVYADPNATGSDNSCAIGLRFYDNSDSQISEVFGTLIQGTGWRKISVTGSAPVGATRCRVVLRCSNGTSSQTGYFDLVVWNLETPTAVSNFLYEAIQAGPATSGSTEPTWPTVLGNTVVDGGVTWKAIGTSIVTWEAIPIMKSGMSQPTWPTTPGVTVADGTMSWTCIDRHISDSKCPNSAAVAIAASHVFAGDKDITAFSAAVDPTDWTSSDNAGYLPTGLNNYGDNPVAVLALYRSNLVVFNSGGYQMWQVDPDPANMALLDAQPVGSIYPRAAQSVSNDLLFLTSVGVRNLGTVGATANMAIGNLGQPVDPIVKAQLAAGTYTPISLYYPGRGQYWLIFGPQAFVLTINGQGRKTWSRFVFPESITDWCLKDEQLYLRTSGNKVWLFDETALQDDVGGTPVNFSGVIQWPYLDMSAFGISKMFVGIDLVGDGAVTIQIAYAENDPTTFSDNPGFATSLNVTPPYTINSADTLPGEPIPIPVTAASYSPILTFSPNQDWNFQAANIYLSDLGGGGATG